MARPYGAFAETHLSAEPLAIALSVDFGMTGSGAAFYGGPFNSTVKGVNLSRGRRSNQFRATDWGFSLSEDNPRAKTLFKCLLDPQIWNASQKVGVEARSDFSSLEEVRNCVRDYLALLLERAVRMISDKLMNQNLIVDLTLTRPTTWTAAVVEDYRGLAKAAFEIASRRCGSAPVLTLNTLRDEAESYAAGFYIFVENNRFLGEMGSIFCVIDVGGATTDPAFLQAIPATSGDRQLRCVADKVVPGIHNGCTNLDNHFSNYVLDRLRFLWTQENDASDIERCPKVLSMMTSVAKSLRFNDYWQLERNRYSEYADFQSFQIVTPTIPADEQNGVNGLSKQKISIEKKDMKDIYDSALITPIHKLFVDIRKAVHSQKPSNGMPCEISHVLLCGGGGLLPRVYECVRENSKPIVTRTNELMAPSLGALHLVQERVGYMHAKAKVSIEGKSSGGSEDMVTLKNEAGPGAPPVFSQKWKHKVGPHVANLHHRFLIKLKSTEFDSESKETTQNWDVHISVEDLTRKSRLGFSQLAEYRICLTLPTTTDNITRINFSAFHIGRDGRETKMDCVAKNESEKS